MSTHDTDIDIPANVQKYRQAAQDACGRAYQAEQDGDAEAEAQAYGDAALAHAGEAGAWQGINHTLREAAGKASIENWNRAREAGRRAGKDTTPPKMRVNRTEIAFPSGDADATAAWERYGELVSAAAARFGIEVVLGDSDFHNHPADDTSQGAIDLIIEEVGGTSGDSCRLDRALTDAFDEAWTMTMHNSSEIEINIWWGDVEHDANGNPHPDRDAYFGPKASAIVDGETYIVGNERLLADSDDALEQLSALVEAKTGRTLYFDHPPHDTVAKVRGIIATETHPTMEERSDTVATWETDTDNGWGIRARCWSCEGWVYAHGTPGQRPPDYESQDNYGTAERPCCWTCDEELRYMAADFIKNEAPYLDIPDIQVEPASPTAATSKRLRGLLPRCNKLMPRAKARCQLPHGHSGSCRSRP